MDVNGDVCGYTSVSAKSLRAELLRSRAHNFGFERQSEILAAETATFMLRLEDLDSKRETLRHRCIPGIPLADGENSHQT